MALKPSKGNVNYEVQTSENGKNEYIYLDVRLWLDDRGCISIDNQHTNNEFWQHVSKKSALHRDLLELFDRYRDK
jgi:hypothetical protein